MSDKIDVSADHCLLWDIANAITYSLIQHVIIAKNITTRLAARIVTHTCCIYSVILMMIISLAI